MKIEPKKQTKLPKYAAALAALSMVSAMTGCGIVQPDGMTEVYTQPESSEIELAGDDVVYTEPEPVLAGEEPIETEPEPQQEPLTKENAAEQLEDAFTEAFSRQNMTVQISPLRSDTSVPVAVSLGEGDFAAAFLHEGGPDDIFAVCFYDGREALEYWNGEEAVTGTYADMIAYLTDTKSAEAFPWGCAATTDMLMTADYRPICRAAFVDISGMDTLTDDEAEQIIKDARGAAADGEAEQDGTETD